MSTQWSLEAIVALLALIALHIGAIKMPTLSKTEWVLVGIVLVLFWWGWL